MRPSFHFTAERGWINDPHGITARDGEYHVFFQYVPERTTWAPNCHWGHATGADLFSLTELPVAIAPGEGDDGIWTGSLVADNGRARIFYTATTQPDIGIGRVRVATPDDEGWIAWSKGAVVAEAPAELDIIAYRDPFVVKEPDGWRMFLGAGLADGTATALSYVSTDLERWAYEGIALQRSTNESDPVWMGALWECPQIIEVDGRHVMVSSVWDDDVLHYAGYAIGRYAGGVFTAESWGRLTYGSSYYAPSFFRDAQGRPCLSFWMRGIADVEAGWASAHSVPHVLTLDGDRLVATPHPDLDAYRGRVVDDARLPGLAGDLRWSPADRDELRISSGDELAATLRVADGELVVKVGGDEWSMPASGDIRVLLDGPVLEVSVPTGVLGAAIAPAGDRLTATSVEGGLEAYELAR
ncbi:glycosyl hydrolase family 32 [Agromyces sp. Soil535]|nr:glycosyl hydrolase family 32 [Agromyces sp. Soil535]